MEQERFRMINHVDQLADDMIIILIEGTPTSAIQKPALYGKFQPDLRLGRFGFTSIEALHKCRLVSAATPGLSQIRGNRPG